MRDIATSLAAIAVLAFSTSALAQEQAATTPVQAPPAAATSDPSAPEAIHIPAGTIVQVELTEPLNSETSQQEQLFGLRLAEPIVIDGREIVPAGAAGGGEVIDAAKSSFGGRQGRLIIAGRFLDIGGQRARIRGMQLMTVGSDRMNETLAVGAILGIPALFIQGGEVHLPVGTRANARLAEEVIVQVVSPGPESTTTEPMSAPAANSISGENQQ